MNILELHAVNLPKLMTSNICKCKKVLMQNVSRLSKKGLTNFSFRNKKFSPARRYISGEKSSTFFPVTQRQLPLPYGGKSNFYSRNFCATLHHNILFTSRLSQPMLCGFLMCYVTATCLPRATISFLIVAATRVNYWHEKMISYSKTMPIQM